MLIILSVFLSPSPVSPIRRNNVCTYPSCHRLILVGCRLILLPKAKDVSSTGRPSPGVCSSRRKGQTHHHHQIKSLLEAWWNTGPGRPQAPSLLHCSHFVRTTLVRSCHHLGTHQTICRGKREDNSLDRI